MVSLEMIHERIQVERLVKEGAAEDFIKNGIYDMDWKCID